jgi:nucleoside-diphosphate-sugar epimerase
MNIDRSTPVLVTGGNGYIASWLVKYLLEDGVDVHATVRDPSNTDKVGHLTKLAENSPGTLTLFSADLLDDGAFDEAMAGCELVFHTASPFVISGIKDPQKDLVDPAVQGTRNALDSANRVSSVKRVVLTSSVVSVYGDAVDLKDAQGDVFTEDDWNTTSSLTHQPYSFSKVEAERVAWEMAAAQDRWDLVVINPGFVLGPSLTTASNSASFATMKQLVDGTMRIGAPPLELGVVDVRDVARAHVKAGFTPGTSGRHICVSRSMTMLEMGRALAGTFGRSYPFPSRELPKPLVWLAAPTAGLTRKYVATNMGYPLKFDNRRAREELGIEFRPAVDTVVEHFQQLIDDGIVRDKRKTA